MELSAKVACLAWFRQARCLSFGVGVLRLVVMLLLSYMLITSSAPMLTLMAVLGASQFTKGSVGSVRAVC